MTLQFPTMAEQVLKEFQDATGTTSIAKIAARHKAEVIKHWDRIEYVFDDDTSLITTGRGEAHKAWTELP